ncbi:MAG: hypothetical protein IJB31_02225 [Akkermansia sp.]|nr:hypothetical protein [Akkermansia sp.]
MAEQSNPGRNALIIGILLGLATGGLGVYTMVSSKTSVPVTNLDAAGTAADSLTAAANKAKDDKERSRKIVDIAPEGAVVNNKPRFTPIFFSPELWQVSIDSKKMTTVIDIYDPKAESLHNGVPNSWFISNNISDALGRADGLAIDSDGDGFTNMEEFGAKTSPSDPNSLPPLIEAGKPNHKLEVVATRTDKAVIEVEGMLAYDANPTETSITIHADRSGTNRLGKKFKVKPGDSFDLSGKMDGASKRFTVVGFEKMTYSDSVGNKSEESALRVRDNVTLTGEKEFVIRAGFTRLRPGAKNSDIGTPNVKGRDINDSSATLRVTAGPKAGKTFDVMLNDTFQVPGNEKISCKLESIDAQGTVNVRPEGAESPILVPKAAK